MKEVSVEEITDLIKTSLKESINKHYAGQITPEGKEILKKKLVEMVEDLQSKGIVTVIAPDKEQN